ncbi:MAG: TlpA family protein disulfide reductase [Polyangiaceae bacterium]|nr:TlpA family protein disulfide reductase [Polyangiaceae bacterium]
MRALKLAEYAFVLVAAVTVYRFVKVAVSAEQKRVCAPLCALGPAYAGTNRTAPDFDLPSLHGTRVRLSDYRGRVVVLNFWTRTCRPCREELPSLALLADSAEARGITVVTVATDDEPAQIEEVLRALLGRPAPFVVAHDPDGAVVTGRYGTRLYPETWVIDPHGVIRARFDGARDWSDPMVTELLSVSAERLRCGAGFASGLVTSGPRWACGEVTPTNQE